MVVGKCNTFGPCMSVDWEHGCDGFQPRTQNRNSNKTDGVCVSEPHEGHAAYIPVLLVDKNRPKAQKRSMCVIETNDGHRLTPCSAPL